MDDVTMVARVDDETTIYVSPVHDHTYREFVESDNLGGALGYFIARERGCRFEILAKAVDLEAARELFGLMTSRARSAT